MDSYLQYQNALSDTLQQQELASAKASVDPNKRLEQAKEVVEPITGSFIKEAIKPTIISAGKVLGKAGISGAEEFAKDVSEKGLAETLGERLNQAISTGQQAVRDTMSNARELSNVRMSRALKLSNPNADEATIANNIKVMNDPKAFAEKFRSSRPDKDLSDEDIEKFRQYKVNKLLKKGTIADEEESALGDISQRGSSALSSAVSAGEEASENALQPAYRVLADISGRARSAVASARQTAEEGVASAREDIPSIPKIPRPDIEELGEVAEQEQPRLLEPQLTRLQQLRQLPSQLQEQAEQQAKQISTTGEDIAKTAVSKAEDAGEEAGKAVSEVAKAGEEAGEEVGKDIAKVGAEEGAEEASILGGADLLGPIGLIAGVGITTALALAHKHKPHIQTPAPISTQFGL